MGLRFDRLGPRANLLFQEARQIEPEGAPLGKEKSVNFGKARAFVAGLQQVDTDAVLILAKNTGGAGTGANGSSSGSGAGLVLNVVIA